MQSIPVDAIKKFNNSNKASRSASPHSAINHATASSNTPSLSSMSQPQTIAMATAATATIISSDALLFLSEQGHSIYENTRMSGEQVRRHVLPIDAIAEASGLSNDADEETLYARSLLGLLASPSSSHL